ncbi:zinc knuckle CX2CX4HX4C containing protein [Tanacetum coccineum]
MRKNGFFFFQFATRDGTKKVLESGPWLVRSVPLILNIWTPNVKLIKDEITSAPVWVKLHNVPILSYSEIGLSLITTQLGKPIMLDSYTSSMCLDPWGKSTYARALIEMKSDKSLLESVVVVQDGNDGFVIVTRKKGKVKAPPKKQIGGIRLTKPKPNMYYRRVKKGDSSNHNEASAKVSDPMPKAAMPNSISPCSGVELKNKFTLLDEDDGQNVLNIINESDSEEVDEEMILEGDKGHVHTDNQVKGASTPIDTVSHD